MHLHTHIAHVNKSQYMPMSMISITEQYCIGLNEKYNNTIVSFPVSYVRVRVSIVL